MAEILEVIMMVSFGASWPLNLIKSYKARTTKGKSLAFLCLIFFGYIAGITSKLINENYMSAITEKWYVLFFYVLNLIMVGADLIMYFRNLHLEKQVKNPYSKIQRRFKMSNTDKTKEKNHVKK